MNKYEKNLETMQLNIKIVTAIVIEIIDVDEYTFNSRRKCT